MSDNWDKLKKFLESLIEILSKYGIIAEFAKYLICKVLHYIKKETFKTLKEEIDELSQFWDSMHRNLQRTLLQTNTCELVKNYWFVEEHIHNHFRKLLEMLEANPKQQQRKKDDYKKSYTNNRGDQNLHILFEGIVGKEGNIRPILEVYQYKGNKEVMEYFCSLLTCLFCMGLIVSTVINDATEWLQKLKTFLENILDFLRRSE